MVVSAFAGLHLQVLAISKVSFDCLSYVLSLSALKYVYIHCIFIFKLFSNTFHNSLYMFQSRMKLLEIIKILQLYVANTLSLDSCFSYQSIMHSLMWSDSLMQRPGFEGKKWMQSWWNIVICPCLNPHFVFNFNISVTQWHVSSHHWAYGVETNRSHSLEIKTNCCLIHDIKVCLFLTLCEVIKTLR